MSNNHSQCIRAFVDSAKAFDYCVQQDYPAGLLDFVPDIAGAWSSRAHIAHVLDADLMCHHRLRLAIAEPGFTVPLWDEEAWQANLYYHKQNVTASVSLLRILRSLTGSMLEQLSPAQWDAAYSIHPVRGRMDITAWLELYTGHIPAHLDYIKRNEAAWEKAGRPNKTCH